MSDDGGGGDDGDEPEPTAAESPAARHGQHGQQPTVLSGEPTGRGQSSLHSATADRALEAEQRERARSFGRLIALMCGVSLAAILIFTRAGLDTPLWLQLLMSGSLALSGATGALVWVRIRTSRRPRWLMRAFGAVCLVTALATQYYAGVFSPAPAVIVLGVSYFGLADDRSLGYLLCVGASVGYLVLATLITAELIPDAGLFRAAHTPVLLRAVAVLVAIAIFSVMLWQARVSRAATLQAVERLDEALRQVQHRDALIDEVNQNLDVALGAGAGGNRGVRTGGLAGPYRLGELLGRGGMGEVYAAADVNTGRRAAVKLLHGRAQANPDTVERFLREAEVATRLRADSLVEIYQLGEAEGGAPFIAMELLVGHDLGWHLRRQQQLPLDEVVALARDIASGLVVAHAAGVIHRDLKPANLFRVDGHSDGGAEGVAEGGPARRKGQWKILDFGVAKLRGSTGTLTQHAIVGTPGYMSPEQAQGHDVDARSDLFSLGAVLYRALTGRPPFSGPDTPQVLFDIVYRNPVRPSELVPSLPPAVDAVLAVALAKDRADRFGDPCELAAALAATAAGQPLPATVRRSAAALLRKLPWGAALRPR